MTKSFDMLLNRDRNLNSLTDKAADLRDSAKGFKDSSKKLKMSMYFKQYMYPIIACAAILFFFILSRMI